MKVIVFIGISLVYFLPVYSMEEELQKEDLELLEKLLEKYPGCAEELLKELREMRNTYLHCDPQQDQVVSLSDKFDLPLTYVDPLTEEAEHFIYSKGILSAK